MAFGAERDLVDIVGMTPQNGLSTSGVVPYADQSARVSMDTPDDPSDHIAGQSFVKRRGETIHSMRSIQYHPSDGLETA